MNEKNNEIPVYVFMGFLGSGKTKFATETLVDNGFTEGKSTLLLVAEEGELEYDKAQLEALNIHLEFVDDDNLTEEHLLELSAKYKPENVMLEYNLTSDGSFLFSVALVIIILPTAVITAIQSKTMIRTSFFPAVVSLYLVLAFINNTSVNS